MKTYRNFWTLKQLKKTKKNFKVFIGIFKKYVSDIIKKGNSTDKVVYNYLLILICFCL